jgi:hypothetical protein
MAWENRGKQKTYFYRSERVDGQVRKTYLGSGMLAEVESIRLERKAMQRAQITAEKQQTITAETLLKHQIQNTADLTFGLMASVGFTNERYRGWRPIPVIALQQTDSNEQKQELSEQGGSFRELADAARQGDRSVVPALRRMLRENPALARSSGELAGQTQIHWIDLIAGQDLYRRECLLMKLAELKWQLRTETNGTVVEHMLVDQAISTWLQLYYHEDREAKGPAENIKLGEFRLKKIESAFNRHMRSLSALTALKAVNFTQRMAETMASVAQNQNRQRPESTFPPPTESNGNRLKHAFSQSFELASDS